MGWESGVRKQQWLIHEGGNLEKLQPGEALCCVAGGVLQQTCLSAVAEQTVLQQTCLSAVAASLWMHLLGSPCCPDPQFCPPAIRFGRMPEAEKRKLVAGLTASEIGCQNPQVADLKAFSKHIYNAYLKNFNMTKKKARGILTGKASSTPVSSLPGQVGFAMASMGDCPLGDAA